MANMFSSFFNPDDAYKKAGDVANQSWQQVMGFEKPYQQQGLDQYGRLNSAENALLDPAKLQSQWASGYETSPYAQMLLNQNKTNGLDAASSMGLMGSSAALGNIQNGAGNIVSADRQQYLNDLMQKYMSGIGIGQNIYGTGASTAANLGNQGLQHGQDMAQLKYGEEAAPGQLFSNLLKNAISGIGNFATSGFGAFGNAGMPAYARNAISGNTYNG